MKNILIQNGGNITPNKKVYVNVIIDESGSMSKNRASVISGVNEYVNDLKQKSNNIDYILNVIKFNTESRFAIEEMSIKKFEQFRKYSPTGGTALLDAVGDAITRTDSKFANDAIFIILTDGEENSSRRYSKELIKEMIQNRQAKGWVFTYLGADANSWNAATSIGINTLNTIIWNVDNASGTLRAASAVTSNYYASANSVNNDLYSSIGGEQAFSKMAEELSTK